MLVVKNLRILLLITVVTLHQIFMSELLTFPVILTVLHLVILGVANYSNGLIKNYRITYILLTLFDCSITLLYILFINPLLITSFIIIHILLIAYESDKASKLLVYIYIVLFFILSLINRGEVKENLNIPVIVPTFIIIIVFLNYFLDIVKKHNQENDYLKSLLDNKNKLLSTLTHELRTPLTVIKTSNELIIEERPGPINDVQRSLLQSSIDNTIRLTSIVDNILSQVKVEFSWFEMEKSVIDVRTMIRKVATDIRPFLDTKNQIIQYNYPGLLSKTIGDKRWLQQVFLNLIHNSSKNSPDGSRIDITVKENEQCIVVSVHDYGTGIQNHEISQVFNEFYQSTNPAKDLTDGAGLGLTIVNGIIEKHGGKVYISSIPDIGTTVSFTLPIFRGVFSEIFDISD